MELDWLIDHKKEEVLPALREIFFLSADPRNVSDNEAKNDAFFEKWAGYYLRELPEWILLAWEGSNLLAYLMCEPDSRRALTALDKLNPSYKVFADQFEKFPAHLHMNAHPTARGKGVGSQLITRLVERLKLQKSPGLHLVTSPGQRNAEFYRKNGFTHEVLRDFKGYPLLFMGRSI